MSTGYLAWEIIWHGGICPDIIIIIIYIYIAQYPANTICSTRL